MTGRRKEEKIYNDLHNKAQKTVSNSNPIESRE
jgi:hypothetical protein